MSISSFLMSSAANEKSQDKSLVELREILMTSFDYS